MNARTQFILWQTGIILLTGCRSAEESAGPPPPLPQFSHPRDITNPYLPLVALKRDVLENKSARIERTAKPELTKTIKVGERTIEALVVEDRDYESGKLVEVTLDYYAQGDDGAVYYLGEDVDEYKNDKVVGHSGAWLLGRDTMRPGVFMPAHPKVGDKYKAEDVPKITWERDEVVSVSEKVVTPAGTYQNCVKVKEKASDGATEYKHFAPGVGCVMEAEGSDPLRLKSHETVVAAK